MNRAGALDLAQPSLAPENRACLLTAIVRRARTTQSLKKHDILCRELPHARAGPVITGFHNPFRNLMSPPTKVHHFWHERQLVQSAIIIQGLQDLCWRLYFNKVTRAKFRDCRFHVILAASKNPGWVFCILLRVPLAIRPPFPQIASDLLPEASPLANGSVEHLHWFFFGRTSFLPYTIHRLSDTGRTRDRPDDQSV